jgi:uncharacterized membrane protein YfhO
MKKFFIGNLPLIIICATWLIFASPYFLKGLVPFPSDYLVNIFAPWNAYPDFASPVKNSATPDVITQIYPWKKLVVDIWKEGTVPLWNPYSFSGTPLLANYQSAVLSPFNVLYFILPFIDAWSVQVLLQPLLAGIFTYLFARSLKLEKLESSVSSLAFMFCGFITTWMVYGTLGYAILFLPLALYSVEKFYQTGRSIFIVVLALAIPLSFFSGHFQTSLYFLIFIFVYLLFKYLSTKKARESIQCFIAVLFGLAMSAPQLLPSVELYFNSVRSEIFIKTEVIPWSYLPTFLAPDFYGNPVTRNDWFGHYAEWNAYIGVIPLILAFYSIRKRTNLHVIFFFVISLASIVLAFQTPILDALIALKIPVVSTSAASRIIVLFSFASSILAGFGFKSIRDDLKNRNIKPIGIAMLIFTIFFLSLWILAVLNPFAPPDKAPVSLSNTRLPFLLFVAFVSLVAFLLIFKKGRLIRFFAPIVILIIILDLYRFANKWQPFEPKHLVFPEVTISKFLLDIPDNDRVFGNFGAEASVTYKIPSIEGYDPLYIERYGEFIQAASDGKFHKGERSVVLLSKNAQHREKAVDFLGVKYLAHKVSDNNTVWAYPIWEYPVDQFKIKYEDDYYQVFENQKVYGRALIVGDFEVINDDKKLLALVFDDDSDLKQKVYLEKKPTLKIHPEAKGEAVIKTYEPSKIIIETVSSHDALLVLSDVFYPGWVAQVDSEETEILRANYAFRAIEVPSGKHIVAFSYRPGSFARGLIVGFFGIIGVAGQTFYLRRR